MSIPLTEKELAVAELAAYGLTNQEIARALGLVLGTVKSRMHRILFKLGVAQRWDIDRALRGLK